MQRSPCAHIPYGLTRGLCDLRGWLAGAAKHPEDTGVHVKVVSACLELEQQAVVFLVEHDGNRRSMSKAATVSISDGFCNAPF